MSEARALLERLVHWRDYPSHTGECQSEKWWDAARDYIRRADRPEAPPEHPDNGHPHHFTCIGCGVDAPDRPEARVAVEEVVQPGESVTLPQQGITINNPRPPEPDRTAALDEERLANALRIAVDADQHTDLVYSGAVSVEAHREAFARRVAKAYAALAPTPDEAP